MFRSTIVKSAAIAAARRSATVAMTTRSIASVSRPAVVLLRVNKPAAAWKIGAIRGYASGGGLSKEDVEGRITSMLAGFDKVRLRFWLPNVSR